SGDSAPWHPGHDCWRGDRRDTVAAGRDGVQLSDTGGQASHRLATGDDLSTLLLSSTLHGLWLVGMAPLSLLSVLLVTASRLSHDPLHALVLAAQLQISAVLGQGPRRIVLVHLIEDAEVVMGFGQIGLQRE